MELYSKFTPSIFQNKIKVLETMVVSKKGNLGISKDLHSLFKKKRLEALKPLNFKIPSKSNSILAGISALNMEKSISSLNPKGRSSKPARTSQSPPYHLPILDLSRPSLTFKVASMANSGVAPKIIVSSKQKVGRPSGLKHRYLDLGIFKQPVRPVSKLSSTLLDYSYNNSLVKPMARTPKSSKN
jgi:hypothetical protein